MSAEVIRSWIPCPNGHEVGQVLLTPCEECCPDEGAGMDLDGYETWTSTGKQDARADHFPPLDAHAEARQHGERRP